METTRMMMILLVVWALPVQAERNDQRPATQEQDASPLVMAVQLSEANQTRLRKTRNASRPALRKLGPAPKVYLTPERIAEVVGGIQAGAPGDVLIVDCHGNFDHDTIQGAIDAASDGDIIVVLPNTCTEESHYFENINFLGKAITVQSILPTDAMVVDATVINGSLLESVVTFDNGEGQGSVLDGLTITAGLGTSLDLIDDSNDAPIHWGGGVICLDSSPTIRNCRIIGNQATHGGGIACTGGQPTIIYCDISENMTNVEPVGSLLWLPIGGGLDIWSGSAILRGCRISNNLVDASFEDVPLNGSGGGISFSSEAVEAVGQRHLEITGCLVMANELIGDPGFVFNGAGGGLVSWQFGAVSETHALTIRNSMILDNLATRFGAGLTIGNGIDADIQGTTVAGNNAETPFASGIGGNSGVVVVLRNSIIHHNSPMDLSDGDVDYTIEYSTVGTTSGFEVTGPGNISADPLFADPEDGDYHLSADSPCVDAGDPDFVAEEGETDIDGDERIVGERVDMGADEFLMTCAADLDGDGGVGPTDLAMLLGSWGDCADPGDCLADLNDDGEVGPFDLASLLGAWGPCP